MVPSSSGGPSRPMNDWMTSVADIPDDADDDLSGISPELVLVDPELARLVRERQPVPATPALTRASSLRLVRAIDPTEAPIVPRPSPRSDVEVSSPVRDEPSTPAPATPQRDEAADATPASVAPPAPAIEAEPEPALDPVPAARVVSEPEPEPERAVALPVAPVVAEPEPELIVPATRIVEAEPARALEPPRREIPAPLAEPARRPRPETLEAPEPSSSATTEVAVPVMPHPVARPTTAAPTRRTPSTRRKGRRGLALLVGVAAASVAVLGFLQLTGGSPGPADDGGGGSAVGTPPSAKATHTSKTGSKATVKAKATAKSALKSKSTATTAQPKSSEPKAARKPTQPKARQPTPKQKAAPSKSATSRAPNASSGAKQSPARRPTTAAPVTGPTTRRFAWAPVVGATGYHVELFRGADRVLAQETTEPVLELGSTWRYEGRTVRLTPGTYRWYVWPVTKSGRATQAVVQAKLTIP